MLKPTLSKPDGPSVASVALLAQSLRSDCANKGVSTRNYAHRARVIRQQTELLNRSSPGENIPGDGSMTVTRQADDGDQCILRSWHEWSVEGSDRRIFLCIETDLELRPGFLGFDREKLDILIAVAAAKMRSSPSPIDAIRIVPAR